MPDGVNSFSVGKLGGLLSALGVIGLALQVRSWGELDGVKPVRSPLIFFLHLVLLVANELHADRADVELFVVPNYRLLLDRLLVVGLCIMRIRVFRLLKVKLLRRYQLAPIHYSIFRFQNFAHFYFFVFAFYHLMSLSVYKYFCSQLFSQRCIIINNEF